MLRTSQDGLVATVLCSRVRVEVRCRVRAQRSDVRGVHGQTAPKFGRKPHLDEGRYCGLLLIRWGAGYVQLQQLLQVVAVACHCVAALARLAHVLQDVHFRA